MLPRLPHRHGTCHVHAEGSLGPGERLCAVPGPLRPVIWTGCAGHPSPANTVPQAPPWSPPGVVSLEHDLGCSPALKDTWTAPAASPETVAGALPPAALGRAVRCSCPRGGTCLGQTRCVLQNVLMHSLLGRVQEQLCTCQASQDSPSLFSMGRKELYLETNKVSFFPSFSIPHFPFFLGGLF